MSNRFGVKTSLLPNRPCLDEMTGEQLVAEYAWCEEASALDLDYFDQLRVDGRRRAIEIVLRWRGLL